MFCKKNTATKISDGEFTILDLKCPQRNFCNVIFWNDQDFPSYIREAIDERKYYTILTSSVL